MTLTHIQVSKALPRVKKYKIHDGNGLYLLVMPNGSKYWRLKYKADGKYKELALGVFPEVKLPQARKRRDDERHRMYEGIDPVEARRARRLTNAGAESFEAVAREWYARNEPIWSEGHASRVISRLERDVFPWLGKRAVADIAAPELLQSFRRVEARGAIETAHRVKQYCGQVFRYAVATGRAQRDPTGDLRGALTPTQTKHFSSITEPAEVAELLRAIDGFTGTFVVKCALLIAPLVFARPGELRAAEWADFDLDRAEWRYVVSKTKKRNDLPHIVPLSTQAVAILQELYPLTGQGQYLFPSARGRGKCMSDATINAALRRMSFGKEQMTAHGFRAMARTLLAEQGWHTDAIERQLAHKAAGPLGAAYDRAQFLDERRRMMQAWSDYLDGLKRGANIIPIRTAR